MLRHGDPNTIKREKGQGWIEDGYRRIYRNGKHVYEHRIVMEEHLGRPLYDNENVHHKNGVRSDNRLENLELWITAQPYGQHVDDTVTHALEVLRRYKPEALDESFKAW